MTTPQDDDALIGEIQKRALACTAPPQWNDDHADEDVVSKSAWEMVVKDRATLLRLLTSRRPHVLSKKVFEIIHAAWHALDDSEDRGEEGTVIMESDAKNLIKAMEAAGYNWDDHPRRMPASTEPLEREGK